MTHANTFVWAVNWLELVNKTLAFFTLALGIRLILRLTKKWG